METATDRNEDPEKNESTDNTKVTPPNDEDDQVIKNNSENLLEKKVTTIQCLPIEILEKIFKSLSHNEQLISRLVCKVFNEGTLSLLGGTSFFVLSNSAEESHQLLVDSSIPWTSLQICDYGFVLPMGLKILITTLDLHVDEFDLKETMKLLSGFPNVTTLNITTKSKTVKYYVCPKSTDTKGQDLERAFKESLAKLKNIFFSFPFNYYDGLNELLGKLNGAALSLVVLHIVEHPATPRDVLARELWSAPEGWNIDEDYMEDEDLDIVELYKVISSSARTLRTLALTFHAEGTRKVLFPEVILNLNQNDTFQLERVAIVCNPLESTIPVDRDFLIHQELLKTQTSTVGFRTIVLPWTSNVSLCQEFVSTLPHTLTSIGCVHREHITDEFPSEFEKLKKISIVVCLEPPTNMFSRPCPTVENLQVNLHLKVPDDFEPNDLNGDHIYLMKNLAETFSNLLELIIAGRDYLLTDLDLQVIIKEFQNLEVLEVQASDNITDRGVTGLLENYCQELSETRKLYLYVSLGEEFVFPNDKMLIGMHPISSMRKLKKLSFHSSAFTDVGLYFGFRFGSAMKHLGICSRSFELSDWGLYWLGKYNPGLEVLHASVRGKGISTVDNGIIRKQFPLIESTQKFKFNNF